MPTLRSAKLMSSVLLRSMFVAHLRKTKKLLNEKLADDFVLDSLGQFWRCLGLPKQNRGEF